MNPPQLQQPTTHFIIMRNTSKNHHLLGFSLMHILAALDAFFPLMYANDGVFVKFSIILSSITFSILKVKVMILAPHMVIFSAGE